MKANWLDRTIGFVAPSVGLRRVRARTMTEVIERHYEAGSHSRRTKGWRTSSGSANAEIFQALSTIRDRSRYLVRNNSYAARGIQAISTHTVGEGIIPQYSTGRKKIDDLVAKKWEEWGETTDCDADGLLNFYGLQALAMREVPEAGEVLIRRRKRKSTDGLPVPLQLQMIEADFIDSNRNEVLSNGGVIVQGIEFNAVGRVVAYWLYQSHPGDLFGLTGLSQVGSNYRGASKRIPAEEIIHLYRVDRAGQSRGVPWLAPCMMRLRDFDAYEDAQLLRQKIASCFAAFIYDSAPPDTDNLSQDGGDNDVDRVEPGTVEYLGPGKDIRFSSPPAVEGYAEYSRISLTAVATCLGITYESLTQDLSNATFSAGRMGRIGMYENIGHWRWHMLVPRMGNRVYEWFLESLSLSEGITFPAKKLPEWTEPKKQLIDPQKEVDADNEAIRACQTSLSEVIRSRGMDPKKVFAERSSELQLLDSLGIVASSDPRADKSPSLSIGGSNEKKKSD